jgi:hypothetical protein
MCAKNRKRQRATRKLLTRSSGLCYKKLLHLKTRRSARSKGYGCTNIRRLKESKSRGNSRERMMSHHSIPMMTMGMSRRPSYLGS